MYRIQHSFDLSVLVTTWYRSIFFFKFILFYHAKWTVTFIFRIKPCINITVRLMIKLYVNRYFYFDFCQTFYESHKVKSKFLKKLTAKVTVPKIDLTLVIIKLMVKTVTVQEPTLASHLAKHWSCLIVLVLARSSCWILPKRPSCKIL